MKRVATLVAFMAVLVLPAIALGYYINPNVQFTVGYNLIFWSSVVRPGDQIDTTVDDLNVPPTRPTFDFNTTSFWIQSVNLGLTCEF